MGRKRKTDAVPALEHDALAGRMAEAAAAVATAAKEVAVLAKAMQAIGAEPKPSVAPGD